MYPTQFYMHHFVTKSRSFRGAKDQLNDEILEAASKGLKDRVKTEWQSTAGALLFMAAIMLFAAWLRYMMNF